MAEIFALENRSCKLLVEEASDSTVQFQVHEHYGETVYVYLSHHEAERMALAILSALNAIRKNIA